MLFSKFFNIFFSSYEWDLLMVLSSKLLMLHKKYIHLHSYLMFMLKPLN